MDTYKTLLTANTREGVAPNISAEIKELIDKLIGFGYYTNDIEQLKTRLIAGLREYRAVHQIDTVVLGMSGGIDSALTASLFKAAKYRVIGVTMPILQNPQETLRGEEACTRLKIEHVNVDLTDLYEHTIKFYQDHDVDFYTQLTDDQPRKQQIRKGNIRARLRMITLYNLASKHNGFVASTDNFSELAAGFWTLHGDVGDVAPIQSLTKSWEVPQLAGLLGVPESIIRAKPTDGLGIADGDEDQLGFSYLEFDAVLLALLNKVSFSASSNSTKQLIAEVEKRIGSTSFKRNNPFNLEHPIEGSTRYQRLDVYDSFVHNKGE